MVVFCYIKTIPVKKHRERGGGGNWGGLLGNTCKST